MERTLCLQTPPLAKALRASGREAAALRAAGVRSRDFSSGRSLCREWRVRGRRSNASHNSPRRQQITCHIHSHAAADDLLEGHGHSHGGDSHGHSHGGDAHGHSHMGFSNLLGLEGESNSHDDEKLPKAAAVVTWAGAICNVVLSVAKGVVGIVSGSSGYGTSSTTSYVCVLFFETVFHFCAV